MSGLTAVSLFAGIEGIGLAFHRAGIKVVAAVEIDPACRGVIARHFPGVALFEDVTEVTGDQLRAAGFVPERGVLAGGWPCQDLSVAGRRAGLSGTRSGLFWEVVRLAGELSPQWLILENVDGLLSAVCSCPGNETCIVNGRAVACGRWEVRRGERRWLPNVTHTPEGGACRNGCMPVHGGSMGTVVGALGKLGYGYAGRVLDAEYFGVPQQRNRLFFVGYLGDGARPVQVLFDAEGVPGNPAAGEAAGEDAPGTPARGTGRSGTVGTLGGNGPGGGWRTGADEAAAGQLVVSAIQGGGRRGHRIDAEGAAGGQLVAVPFALRGREGGSQIEYGQPGDPAFTVRTPGGGSSHPMVAVTLTSGVSASPGVNPPGCRAEDDVNLVTVAYALTSRNDRNDRNDREENYAVVPAGQDGTLRPFGCEGMITHALTSEGADASEDGTGRGSPLVPMAFNPQTGGSKPRLGYRETPTAISCTQATGVHTATAVRRLTPRERERLQGFPDDWTRWRLENGALVEQSDSARDRQTGNAVAVPVVEWIARRLVAADVAATGHKRKQPPAA
jgi:DNA (cytosine-5)-methyltransferase 1